MAAAAIRGARLVAWVERLRRGVAAGPLAASVAGVAVAGVGVAWYHGLVNVAAPQGRLTVPAQVGTSPLRSPLPSSSDAGPRVVGVGQGAGLAAEDPTGVRALSRSLEGMRGGLQRTAPPCEAPRSPTPQTNLDNTKLVVMAVGVS